LWRQFFVAVIDLYTQAGVMYLCLYLLRVSQMALADGHDACLYGREPKGKGSSIVQ
jgi:hypothetical protein